MTRKTSSMQQKVITPQMRDQITSALEEKLMMWKSGHAPLVLPDETIGLIHKAADTDPDTTLERLLSEAHYLIKEYCHRETIREYFLLRQYFNEDDNMMVRIMLLLGLHHPARNREPIDLNDPVCIERNIALLSAITLLRKREYQKILHNVVDYNPIGSAQREQGFSDDEFAGLIIDHPQHWELLISTIQERGYEGGIEVFKDIRAINAPALMQGIL